MNRTSYDCLRCGYNKEDEHTHPDGMCLPRASRECKIALRVIDQIAGDLASYSPGAKELRDSILIQKQAMDSQIRRSMKNWEK